MDGDRNRRDACGLFRRDAVDRLRNHGKRHGGDCLRRGLHPPACLEIPRLQNYGNNPNKTITVGELSITYKDYADLLSILAYWRRRADEDETGQTPKANGPKFAKVRFV